MIACLTLLLACQLAGEVIARLTHLPVPGPVLGMLLLFFGLIVKGEAPRPLQETADRVLSHLSLLFVPAGVGIMLHADLLVANWLPIVLSLAVSTALTIAVTALVAQGLARREKSE
jgi:holin-like protein